MRVAAGIDIGGTSVKLGIVDDRGRCSKIIRFPTADYSSVPELANDIYRQTAALIPASATFEGAGIGAPNANYHKGTIDYPPNLPWKGIIPIVKIFQKTFRVPCSLVNDANAAALGEMHFGGAKTMDDFIFITLGTGLGSGIVANRKLVQGHDGMAAELGHVIVEKNGRKCGCGRQGCLEAYVSVTGIKNTIKEWISQGKKSMLTEKSEIQAEDIFIAAEQGDMLAKEAFEYTGEILGFALANSVSYTSPEAIFLFGGLTKSKKWLFEPTQKHFENNLMNIYKNKIKILPSGLNENHAPILGAASLILHK